MSPMQRFAEVSRPRFELNWKTVAAEYGVEKLERNQWLIPDAEIFGVAAQTAPIHEPGIAAQGASVHKRAMAADTARIESQPATCLEIQHALVKAGALVLAGADQAEHGRDDPADALTPVHARTDCVEGLGPTHKRNDRAGAWTVSAEQITATPEQDAATGAAIPREQLQRLYSGEDREYVAEPDVERERQHSIEMAGRIATGTNTQLNDHWEVLRDEDAMQPEVRAEIEARGGLEAIPVNREFVLARDGRVMYRTQLQHALERELRMKLGVPESYQSDEQRILWHKGQLARLEKADGAPRCEHIFADGTTCRSPKLRTARWCYAHERMKAIRPKRLNLLPMEDANSIMLNLGEIGRALIDDEISERKAGLLLYQQQQGLIALSRVTFKETDGRAMVVDMPAKPAERKRSQPQRTQRNTKQKPDLGGKKTEGGNGKLVGHEATERDQMTSVTLQNCLSSGVHLNPGDESCKSFRSGDDGGGGTQSDREIGASDHRDIGSSERLDLAIEGHR
jgi:hypothetical protein